MVEYKEHHKSVLMFNCVKNCPQEYLSILFTTSSNYANYSEIIWKLKITCSSFMKKNLSLSAIFQLYCGGQFYLWRTTMNPGNTFKKTFESQKLNNIYMGRFGQIMIYFGKKWGRFDMYSSPLPFFSTRSKSGNS